MNNCTYNSQYFEFDDLYEPSTSGQAKDNENKRERSVAEKDIETDIENDDFDREGEQGEEEEPLWSIDDDTLFHPLGLINHSTEIGKSVFVTWNELYLQNFIFKKSKKTKKINMTKVRLTLPANEEIKEILIMEYNTLLLMKSGNVFYFSSVKSMHIISWLSGVRCISKAPDGFSVIRLLDNKTLSLEMYRDVPGIGKSETTIISSYDITFDSTNLFDCQWTDERYTLLSQIVEKEHLSLMNKFLRNGVDLNPKDIVHFFTVSGHLFALIAGNPQDGNTNSDDFNIKLLNTYATSVECMKIDLVRKICIIFLQCGTIDIWYISSFLKIVQRRLHYTGSSFDHYDYNPSNATFYYTDSEKVGQLEFKYDTIADIYTVQETFKAIPDIVVCSWVDNIQQLIGLSSNNVFYKMSFAPSDAPISIEPNPEFENISNLYKLTKSLLNKLLTKAYFAEELINMPNKIKKQIEEESLKQQLISVCKKKSLYKALFKGSISYKRYIYDLTDSNCLYLFAKSHKPTNQANTIYALIDIQRKPNPIFNKYLWTIHLITGNKGVYNFILPRNLSHNQICIIIPFEYNESELFPVCQVNFLTCISNDCNELLALTLPVELQCTSLSFLSLFSFKNVFASACNYINVEQVLKDFNQKNKKSKASTCSQSSKPAQVVASLSLPKVIKFKDICRILKYENDVIQENEEFSIYFVNSFVKITFIEESYTVVLECGYPIALYYTKLLLIYIVKEILDETASNSRKENSVSPEQLQFYMQCQCDVQRFYGSLTEFGVVTSESINLHLEHLSSIYKKLRATPLHLFS